MRCVPRISVLVITVVAIVVSPAAASAAEIFFCHDVCVCITWTSGATGYSEVRCPDTTPGGWAPGPTTPADGSTGTWSGSGTPKSLPSPLPGNILAPETSVAVSGAKNVAIEKVRGEKVPDMKGVWEPTRCTELFADNPLGRTGAYILGSYIAFRDGTGVKDARGIDMCATGTVSAWTKCCQHDPVVFICPSKFVALSPDNRITKLIHEAMHVAGQSEDTDSTVGPGDPPNPGQIDDVVRKACP